MPGSGRGLGRGLTGRSHGALLETQALSREPPLRPSLSVGPQMGTRRFCASVSSVGRTYHQAPARSGRGTVSLGAVDRARPRAGAAGSLRRPVGGTEGGALSSAPLCAPRPGPGLPLPSGCLLGRVSVSPWGARDTNQLRPLWRGGFTGVWGPARPSLRSQDPLPLRLPLPVVLGRPRGQARHPHTWSHAPFPKACSPGSSRLRGGPQGQVGAAQGVRRAGAAGGVGNLNGGPAGRREGPRMVASSWNRTGPGDRCVRETSRPRAGPHGAGAAIPAGAEYWGRGCWEASG